MIKILPDSVTSIGREAFVANDNVTLYVNSENIKQLLIASGHEEVNIVVKG